MPLHRPTQLARLALSIGLPLGLATWGLAGAGCGDSDSSDGAQGGGGSSGATLAQTATPAANGPGATGGPLPGTCDTDPLETGIVAEQTGVSADIADCAILKWAAEYGEPDPMIVKAMIYGESRFDYASTGCPNLPCGTPDGWTEAESHCYGMMQVVPACGPIADGAGLLANGHPNLELDPGAAAFEGSIYNPDVNVHVGIAGFAGNRAEVEQLYPGCTEDQYTLMALGNLSSHGSTTGCTEYNTEYIDYILPAYFEYCDAAGYAPHDY